MSQQSLFIADGGGSNNVASVTAANQPDGGFSLQGLVARYNATPPTLTDTYLSFLQVDVNGRLLVNASISTSDNDAANPGSALPTQTSWIGASDGTNLQGLLVDNATNKNLRVALYNAGNELAIDGSGFITVNQGTNPWTVNGTVAATQSGTWTVQQGTPPWTVRGTFTTNTAPGTGNAVQGLVAQYNSVAPTIGDGYVTFLQTDVNGALKVTFPAGTDNDAANPGSAVPTQTSWIGAESGGNLYGLTVDNSTNKNLKVALFNGANELAIDSNGYATVNQGTSPWVVSGTVTANQGTSPWVTSVSGTVAVTQSTTPWIVAGQYAPNVAAGSDAEKALTAQYHATGAASAVAGPVDGYRFADTAVTDGNVTYAQTDGYGRLEMSGARAIAYAYENRASQTITLKNTAGVLRKVIVGNAGATGALLTFYDNTAASGTVIAKINTSNVLGQLVFDIPFAVGLTYTTNAKTPGDITLTFE